MTGDDIPTVDPNDDPGVGFVFNAGMSLRDWFAGQALAGLAAHDRAYARTPYDLAEDAYRLADAMLKERAK